MGKAFPIPLLPSRFGFGLLKRFGFPARWRAACAARAGLGFGLLLGYRAFANGDDVVVYRGDLASHTRPDPDREPLVRGLAYFLLVLDFVALGNEPSGRLQQTTAKGNVHSGDLSDQRDDALLGRIGLRIGVLLALSVLGDQEKGVRHPPHIAVAVPYLLDTHV